MPSPTSPTTYTITAALPYANGPIHIGHLAGVYIPADIYARYLRGCGKRVLFVSGSDEHGVPVTIRAQQEGATPQEIVDRYHQSNQESLKALGISFDVFGRTSSKLHHQLAADFFKTLHQRGELETKTSVQYYDPVHEKFLADRYVQGTCPHCGYQEAYGDQCESCGNTLSPEELLQPRSSLSGATLELKETQHWYLPLNRHEDWLRQWILEEHQAWRMHVYGQCKSWLEQGLQPRAITRDLDWGISVPLPGMTNKVLYVWFEAPIGYISATQAWARAQGKDWKTFWQDANTRLVHFVGKDNIVFHCILFPAMLKAHGGFILPTHVPANAFLNLEGRKISTSRNWAVWLHDYLRDFPGQQDTLRYVLCSNAPENRDSDFRWDDLKAKHNNELVAILGNFVHRTLVLTHKYFGGVVPEHGAINTVEEELYAYLQHLPFQVGKAIEQFKFKEGLQLCMDAARAGNKYLADTEPWHLIKTNQQRTGTVLNTALQVVANLAATLHPFLPFTSEKILVMLNMPSPLLNSWGKIDTPVCILTGHKIETPTPLFEKMTNTQIEEQKFRLRK
jgi:methionyl-tRNA synthetase